MEQNMKFYGLNVIIEDENESFGPCKQEQVNYKDDSSVKITHLTGDDFKDRTNFIKRVCKFDDSKKNKSIFVPANYGQDITAALYMTIYLYYGNEYTVWSGSEDNKINIKWSDLIVKLSKVKKSLLFELLDFMVKCSDSYTLSDISEEVKYRFTISEDIDTLCNKHYMDLKLFEEGYELNENNTVYTADMLDEITPKEPKKGRPASAESKKKVSGVHKKKDPKVVTIFYNGTEYTGTVSELKDKLNISDSVISKRKIK